MNISMEKIALAAFSSARTKQNEKNTRILHSIFDQIRRANELSLRIRVILDIDSTLFDTSYRTGGIFKEFARLAVHQEAYPDLCKEISKWKDTVEVYDPIEFVNHHANLKIERNSDTGKYLLSFWKKRFFNDDWLTHDMPYFGAQAFVKRCLDLGADVAYLTGREKASLFDATIKSLAVHGFPLSKNGSPLSLVLKESSKTADLIYKDQGISKLKKGFDQAIFIDNELELIHMAVKNHSDVNSYLFDSVHSGRAKEKKEPIPRISCWALPETRP